MNIKKIVLLSIVFLLLVAGIYLVDKKNEKKEEEKYVINIKPNKVISLSFYDGKDKIQIEKENETWRIKKPISTLADTDEIERILDDLSPLSAEKVVEKDAKDFKKYGLKDTVRKLTLKTTEGKIFTLLIGDKGPLENSYYAMLEGKGTVYLIPEFKKNSFIKTLFDLRNKKFGVFDVDKVNIVKAEIKENNERFELRKDGDNWYLVSPKKFPAKNTKVEDILYSLKSLEAKEIVKDFPKDEDLKNYNLNNPEYRYRVLYGKNSQIEYLISKKDEKWFAFTKNANFIGEINDYSVNDLKLSVEELKEMKVAHIDGYKVNYIHIIAKGKNWEIEKDKNDTWRLKGKKDKILDEDKVSDFLSDIESLEADKIYDSKTINYKEYGLHKPSTTIILKDEDGKVFKILVGKEDKEDKVFVKNDKYRYVYRVDKGFLTKIPDKINDWEKEIEIKDKSVEK